MATCKTCGKKLQANGRRLCNDCHKFYTWKYKNRKSVEDVLKQYEVQDDADKKHKR